MREKDCIFCKIASNEVPSFTIYEDEYVKAFLDLSQGTPGHSLIIPKQHVKDIFEYNDELAEHVLPIIPKVAKAIKKSDPNIIAMNILNNNGKKALQTIFHSHIHLIPRYKDDDFNIIFHDHSKEYQESDYKKIQNKIINNLNQD